MNLKYVRTAENVSGREPIDKEREKGDTSQQKKGKVTHRQFESRG